MNRKTLYIILAALGAVVLVGLLWWWFLGRTNTAPTHTTTGTFGTAQNATGSGTTGTSASQNNVGTVLPTQTSTNIQIAGPGTPGTNSAAGAPGTNNLVGAPNTNSVAGANQVTLNGAPVATVGVQAQPQPIQQAQGQIGTPDAIWLSGTPGGSGTVTTDNSNRISNTPGTVFNPIGVNQIVSSDPTGNGGALPNIGSDSYGQQTGGGGSGLGSALGGAAAAGVITCAAVPALQLAAQALGFTIGATLAGAKQAPALATAAGLAAVSVSTVSVGEQLGISAGAVTTGGSTGGVTGGQIADLTINGFFGCIARNIAKIVLNQITNSVVNWINSGFNGSPSFVQNPSKFLQQTADQAAGSYIKSSALSFLCSPFQLQIKIAIAQSYAKRDANSCTLTQVTKNIQNFMNGNFLSGNWGGMLSFTTIPTNNPYGAFMFASVGITAVTSNAQGQVKTDLLQGQGFLSFQQKSNCSTQSSAANSPGKSSTPLQGPNGEEYYTVCDLKTTTPGSVIQQTLIGTENSTLNSLNLAKSFDEIINALITQLVTRTLQGGLSNLSGAGGYSSNFYTPDQLQTQASSQGLLGQMQSDTAIAGQYAQVQQGSITDIENVQGQLNDLYNCWAGIATSSSSGGAAATNARLASTTLASFNPLINTYNDKITLANKAIVTLEQLLSTALSAQSTADINAVTAQYQSTKARGSIPTQNDVTSAQQDRATLQSRLSTLGSQTAASLAQCQNVH